MTYGIKKKKQPQWWTPLAALVLLLAAGCSAYDLGDEEQANVDVDRDDPSWDGGIGRLVELKCASCHTEDKDTFVPANTPDTIDDISQRGFFDPEKNAARMRMVYRRVYGETDMPMPPEFATQLTPRERAAFKTFLEERLPKQLEQKATPCDPRGKNLSFANDVRPLVLENCANPGCHGGEDPGAGLPSFDDEKTLLSHKQLALEYLREGVMPPGRPNFGKTQAGQTLIDWLCIKTNEDTRAGMIGTITVR